MTSDLKEKTCIIIDDDKFSRETLTDFLSGYKNLSIIKSISDSQLAIKHIAIHKPDLVFLDINMPHKSGMNVMSEINELKLPTTVIFITAHLEYLMDALKTNAFDYLVKPLNKQELDETIKRFLDKSKINSTFLSESHKPDKHSESKIIIRNSYRSLVLTTKDVIYVNADGCYSNVYLTKKKTETISKNIGQIEKYFNENSFFKISRSIIINIKFLTKIDRVKKLVYLTSNETNYELKATKENMISLENLINRLKFHQEL
ncbi:MAG: response regulator transcription factor [Salinivirgaceae bacterium]|nr:response regulator transcription factor [Salinivirgaceae bacterium]